MYRLFSLWRLARYDLRVIWFALGHPNRPAWLIPAAAGLVVYAVDPLNFALPLLGAVDDLIVLPLLLHFMAKILPLDIRRGFDEKNYAHWRAR